MIVMVDDKVLDELQEVNIFFAPLIMDELVPMVP